MYINKCINKKFEVYQNIKFGKLFMFLYFKMHFIDETCMFSWHLNQDAVRKVLLHYNLRYGWKSIDWGGNEWYKS